MMNSPSRLTVSVTLYQDNPEHLNRLVESLINSTQPLQVYFFDNTKHGEWQKLIPKRSNFHYRTEGKNLSYGKGHNRIIEETSDQGDYHLVINPDVFFNEELIQRLVTFMDGSPDVGLVQPRILSPNGEDQPLYKLLPKPLDLLSRRFPSFIQSWFEKSRMKYEMAFKDVHETFEAPFLSGCFMFMRKQALKETRGFDPRYFLYCEDLDLSRRIGVNWKTIYYGEPHVYHYFRKSSYKELRFFLYHVISAIKYFNKYGWMVDAERKKVNRDVIQKGKQGKT